MTVAPASNKQLFPPSHQIILSDS